MNGYPNPDDRERRRLAGEAAWDRQEARNLERYGLRYINPPLEPQKPVKAKFIPLPPPSMTTAELKEQAEWDRLVPVSGGHWPTRISPELKQLLQDHP